MLENYIWRLDYFLISISLIVGYIIPYATFNWIIESVDIGMGSGVVLVVLFIIMMLIGWMGICNNTKRLHDLWMSGWWQCAFIIPIFGWIFDFYVLFTKGGLSYPPK